MNEFKNTPAPLAVKLNNESPYTFCTELTVYATTRQICSFHHLSKEYSETFPREEVEANALLVSLAPDLLKALIDLRAAVLELDVHTDVIAFWRTNYNLVANASELINKLKAPK